VLLLLAFASATGAAAGAALAALEATSRLGSGSCRWLWLAAGPAPTCGERGGAARLDSDGRERVRCVAELELGPAYGPATGIRLIAATDDPAALRVEATWFMATNLTGAEADPAEVHRLYSLRDWIGQYDEPAKHELGWADCQVRPERAIVRHWHLVMLAFTFSLLAGAPRPGRRLAAGTGDRPRRSLRARRRRGSGGVEDEAAHRLAGDPAGGAPLAVPVGAPPAALAHVVDRPASGRICRSPRPGRPLPVA
jgi:hypothetical protein